MRTSVDIPDDLYAALKAQALTERTSIKALLHEGAKLIQKRQHPREPGKVSFPILKSTGVPLPVTHENIHEFLELP